MTTIWTPRWPKRRFFIVYGLHQGGRDVTWKGTMLHFQILHNTHCLPTPPPPPPKFQILLSGPHIPKAFLNNLCNLWEENRVLYEFLFWQPLDNVAVLVDNKYSTVFLLLKFARKISLVPSWKQIKTKQKKKRMSTNMPLWSQVQLIFFCFLVKSLNSPKRACLPKKERKFNVWKSSRF